MNYFLPDDELGHVGDGDGLDHGGGGDDAGEDENEEDDIQAF